MFFLYILLFCRFFFFSLCFLQFIRTLSRYKTEVFICFCLNNSTFPITVYLPSLPHTIFTKNSRRERTKITDNPFSTKKCSSVYHKRARYIDKCIKNIRIVLIFLIPVQEIDSVSILDLRTEVNIINFRFPTRSRLLSIARRTA